MTAAEMWETFIDQYPEYKDAAYEAWQYGVAQDKLAALTLDGTKEATASAYVLYEREGEALPKEGDFSIILDSRDQAVCIIQTKKVTVEPFKEVSEDFAYKEGEGDRTLRYWREVHEEFFTDELQTIGIPFAEDMLTVCEEFEKVFPK